MYYIKLRNLINKKLNGGFTKKKDLVGQVMSGGFSSKIGFFEHLIEETKIRLSNNQNLFLVIIIFFNAVIKNFFKKII